MFKNSLIKSNKNMILKLETIQIQLK